MEGKHPIRVVATRTGLSPHLIRMWERRYQAVTPARTETKRRLYTDQEIARLKLLRRATQLGESISQIAGLSLQQLEQLVEAAEMAAGPGATFDATGSSLETPADFLRATMDAVQRLDSAGIDGLLLKASAQFSQPVVLEQYVQPLMEEIGQQWESGSLRVVHEHVASAVIRTMLGSLLGQHRPGESAPRMVSTTPVGQEHEVGALMATVCAASMGWRTTYLGSNLPAEEIANAAKQERVSVVALSLVYPQDDPRIVTELRKLRRLLPAHVTIVVGGRGAVGYLEVIEEIGAHQIGDLTALRRVLDANRPRLGAQKWSSTSH